LDPVSIETIKAMLETCKRGKLSDARDKASLLVLLDTGMRLAEFLSLNMEDVDPITGTIPIRSGKGRKPRNVYLGDKSRQVLRRYVKERKDYKPCALGFKIWGKADTEAFGQEFPAKRDCANLCLGTLKTTNSGFFYR